MTINYPWGSGMPTTMPDPFFLIKIFAGATMHFMSLEITFLIQSVLITIPGLLTPGPVMAVTIEKGTESPYAGALVTLGHGVVEVPLVILLFFGYGKFTGIPVLRFLLALSGGIFLIYMALKTFKSGRIETSSTGKTAGSAFMAGVIMTIANPFFIIWWATIGSALIVRSTELGPPVSVMFYILHFTSNFIWLLFLSYLSYKGFSLLGRRYKTVVSVICGGILLFFGGYFLLTAIKFFM